MDGSEVEKMRRSELVKNYIDLAAEDRANASKGLPVDRWIDQNQHYGKWVKKTLL